MSTSGEAAAVYANYTLPSCPDAADIFHLFSRRFTMYEEEKSKSQIINIRFHQRQEESQIAEREREVSHMASVFRTLMVSVHVARVNKQPIVWSFCVLAASFI